MIRYFAARTWTFNLISCICIDRANMRAALCSLDQARHIEAGLREQIIVES